MIAEAAETLRSPQPISAGWIRLGTSGCTAALLLLVENVVPKKVAKELPSQVWFTLEEAAVYLRVSVETLAQWRCRGL